MWDDQFPHQEGLIHLNHAGVGPWPRCAHDAVVAFAAENMVAGSGAYPRWLQTEARLRDQLQALINAPSADDIALVKNTSEALSFVAHGLPWRRGDNVVFPRQEFPSNRIVWESLSRLGVEPRAVDLAVADPEAALLQACDAATRLLAVSAVQYADGLRMDLARLAEGCHRKGTLLCVDAIQQLGALPLDVQALGVDFLAADGHKWLLGPEGLGVFYCRPALRDTLRLTQFGWHMVEDMGDFDRMTWVPAHSARRFECGSPNMTAIHALAASLHLLHQVGLAKVAENISGNVSYLIDYVDNQEAMFLISPADPEHRAGIVTFGVAGVNPRRLYQRLLKAEVLCAQRAGGIRFSPHFYTSREQLDQAMERVLELATDCAAP